MNKSRKILTLLTHSMRPVIKNTVLFSSFNGQYSDSPKYVYLKLREKYPDAKIVWIYSEKLHDELPDGIIKVKYGSKEYFKYIFMASVIVENNSGMRASHYWGKRNGLKKIFAKLYSRKRKKQLNISTWHGTPLKHIAADEVGRTDREVHYTNSDYLSAGCSLTFNAFKSAFLNSTPVKMYGTPRNDILVNKNYDAVTLKTKLGLPLNKKIILFAPTFRGDSNDFKLELSGISQMREFDFTSIFAALNEKFGGDWCFVFRVHYFVLLQIDVDGITEKFGGSVINGNMCDDMAEYLCCADVLLTDYSSSMFDFALTGKPCFLYAPDKEHYQNEERGFYIDFNSLPFPQSFDTDGLLRSISDFDSEKYKSDLENFLTEIGNAEDGRASERIVDDIIDFLKSGKKQ